jgi:hypothetical protein
VISAPEPSEYAPFYAGYISDVGPAGPLASMRAQLESTGALLDSVREERGGYRYAPDKWSIREIVGHLADAERIMSCRALRLARGDQAALPGFDENAFVVAAGFDRRTLASLVEEWRTVRRASITLFEGLSEEDLRHHGIVNEGPMSARALAWIIPGHERHHLDVLGKRYGVGAEA